MAERGHSAERTECVDIELVQRGREVDRLQAVDRHDGCHQDHQGHLPIGDVVGEQGAAAIKRDVDACTQLHRFGGTDGPRVGGGGARGARLHNPPAPRSPLPEALPKEKRNIAPVATSMPARPSSSAGMLSPRTVASTVQPTAASSRAV